MNVTSWDCPGSSCTRSKGLQFLQRAVGRVLFVHVELRHLGAGASASVADREGDRNAVAGGRDGQAGVFKSRVR